MKIRINFLGFATMIALAGLWELLVRTRVLDFSYLPPPTEIIGAVGDLVTSGKLPTALLHSVRIAFIAWAVGSVVGIIVGVALGLFRGLWKSTMASVELLRALPIVAFVPVAVLLLGFSDSMELLVATYAAIWPVVINTLGATRTVHVRLLETGQVLGLSPAHVLWKLRLPAATPFILVGVRLSLATAFILTLVAEMIGNPRGLGYGIVAEMQALQPARMFVYVLTTGIVGIVLNALVMASSRLLLKGQSFENRND